MSNWRLFIAAWAAAWLWPALANAAPEGLFDPRLEEAEGQYYRIETVPGPINAPLEIGGMGFQPDGTLLVCTRRGDVWSLHDKEWKRFATGLDEPLGLCVVNSNEIVVAQRSEMTRLIDVDHDGVADRYETLTSAWNYSGHGYEFAFGPVRDHEGNFFGALACWFFSPKVYERPPYIGWEMEPPASYRPNTNAAWRSWCFKVTPQGEFIPWASGFRSPNGLVIDPEGELLVMDNQGEYIGSDQLYHAARGSFQGFPVSMFWGTNAVEDPFAVPIETLDARRAPPILVFPYDLMGRSASEPVFDLTQGKFGPFARQLFVGDVTQSSVMRASLEKVGGEYQGACYPFRRGFESGNNRAAFGPDGALWVGETARGWGSIGGKAGGLQKLVWTGAVPFEIEKMELTPEGFDLTFTKPVDPAAAQSARTFQFQHYYYKYDRQYFAPIMANLPAEVLSAKVSADGRKVALRLSALIPQRVYQLNISGLKAADGSELLHGAAYYTLNRLRAP
ncbi:MAG TPA: hypothetical protein VHB20_13985 [Verrucomicrobiae bacterium]|jgi:hypothetical protein|nr:hypothetical protein [Verrucomicrobiae bacterium]